MPTVLITGASGFIGENLAHHLLGNNCQVYLVRGTLDPHAKGEKTFAVNLSVRGDFSRVVGDVPVDAVVHTAAVSAPKACEEDPGLAHAVNVEGTREVAQWAHDHGARMIYFSTDLVFDGMGSLYTEEDTPSPYHLYGRTKLKGEEEVQRTCSDWVILRLALSYGPTRGARGDWTREMRSNLGQGKNLTLYTDQYRTPAYTGDTVEAVLRLVRGQDQGIYHMGGGERLNRYEFGKIFARIFGLPQDRFLPVQMDDVPVGFPRAADCSLSTEKISRDISLSPCGVEQGLIRQKREEESFAE